MPRHSTYGLLGRSCRAAAVALALTACLAVPSLAQDAAAAPPQTVSINIQNQPVQTALKLLFTNAGKNYSIDPAVQGNVTLNISGVSFDVALRSLLGATNPPLQSDITDGIYQIKVKQYVPQVINNPNGPNGGPATTQPLAEGVHAYRIPVDHYDAAIIAYQIAQASGKGTVVVVPPNYVAGGGGNNNGGGGGGQGGFGGGGQGGFGGGGQGGFGGGGNSFGGGGGGFGGGGNSFGGGGGGFGGGGGGFGGGGGGFGGGGGGFGGGFNQTYGAFGGFGGY